MSRLLRVALLIETSREHGRRLLRGIIRYQRERGPWSIYFQPRAPGDAAPNWLKSWQGDGILVRIENRRIADLVQKTGLPAVDLKFGVPNLEVPSVGIDNHSVMKLALNHFLDRGFSHFAFCGYPRGEDLWMDYRGDLFRKYVEEAGMTCEIFSPPGLRQKTSVWDRDQEQLAKWIRRLKRPIAIMACHDDRGLQVLDACRRAQVQVPDEVAVLGVDNDEFLCGLAAPPLTSIDTNVERIGYTAAELLERMIKTGQRTSQVVLLPASGVVARQSTDSLAVDDPQLVASLKYLREHVFENVRVSDMARAAGMEQRTLNRRMQAALGRTPKEEMLRMRIDEARRLLAQTELSIKKVAISTGFSTSRYFNRIFHLRTGMTPGVYRESSRLGDSVLSVSLSSIHIGGIHLPDQRWL